MSRKIKDVPTSPLLENATDNNVGDLISRQQAIRWVKTECNPYGKPTLDFESGKKVIEHLEQMSPAQPEPHWIPVTERLPEPYVNVLVSHRSGVAIAWYNGFGFTQNKGLKTVTAWMPLPEPFKEVTT